PRYEIEKTYYVLVDKPFTLEHRKQLEQGMLIEGKKTWPAKIQKLTENEFEITIHEGRNRIVRKMMEALGYFVIRLVRVKIGSVEIGKLMLGKWRELTSREVESFLKR
ncbi:TPA: rRNA pseudouridine synthase, partial [Candidatus Woesearchaeota archaeon]|nr:rRNA pseudouridine synthase [Candidatus Woesearchaeota archaeon]